MSEIKQTFSEDDFKRNKSLTTSGDKVPDEKPATNASASTDKRKRLKNLIPFFVAFAVAGLANYYFGQNRLEKQMVVEANNINKTCPFMLDKDTRVDNTIATTGKRFQYNFTLVNVERINADTLSIKNYLEPRIISNTRSNPEMKLLRDNDVTLIYYYKDKNGEYLFEIFVSPDEYKKDNPKTTS